MNFASLALICTILFPMLGSAILAVCPFENEIAIARTAIGATLASTVSAFAAAFIWIINGAAAFNTPEMKFFSIGHYHFDAGLSLNWTAAAFLFLVQFTSGIVIRFSRIYMHREPGFRRFFAIVLMFQGAMALLTLATHLDLFFFGWEIVGLASFLLIGFYYEREQTVRNALKTLSIYRVADIGLFLAAYLELTNSHMALGLLLLLAAAGKSAQFPFSFWIVRAMEGPTPSSALFYGALSVNAGAYLLLKTHAMWDTVPLVRICIGAIGITTAILCSMFSRVQHTIKGQVGYASATQVGIIFVEIALGLYGLAVFHMVSNAVFRCYQLLVSPSAAAYLLRQQSAATIDAKASEEHSLFQRILSREGRSTLYVFAVSEGYLENLLRAIFWTPLRQIGEWQTGNRRHRAFLISAILIGVIGVTCSAEIACVVLALIVSILALANIETPTKAVAILALSALLASVSVLLQFHDSAAVAATSVYGISVLLLASAAMIGYRIAHLHGRFSSALALLGTLALTGFPLLPTFYGEDMLLHQAFRANYLFAFLLSGLFALNGYIVMRLFAHTFFRRDTSRELLNK